MKQLTILLLFILNGLRLFAQQEKSDVHKGNQLYQEKKYSDAEASYRRSVEKKAQSVEGSFNLGDALYKQKKFADAGQQFVRLAAGADNKMPAGAYHNLGNSYLENKKLEESIDAYKKALMNNPKDDQTRYNLAYAQEKLKQQQQQNKDKKNNDKKNQDNKNKDQDKKDQDKKDQDKQNQDKKDKDKKDQQKEQKPQPDKLSKDDAERMLEALNNDEKHTQDKLKNKKLKGVKMNISKDW